MQCPKCPGSLQAKTYGRKITVHRCSDCGGLWCKPQVLLEMKKEWMSEAVLDSGDPKLGSALNQLADIKCPEDGTLMDKKADAKQTHIWYESCPTCNGMFFDAGEFTDLKYDTLMDRVRDFVKGRRKG
ncbi:MAG: zf-TFIIB domain-containing protein [Pseudomonadales bacterium]|nr:zf-TFIIB domain-containing protein [Pseudomonadales bacterium]